MGGQRENFAHAWGHVESGEEIDGVPVGTRRGPYRTGAGGGLFSFKKDVVHGHKPDAEGFIDGRNISFLARPVIYSEKSYRVFQEGATSPHGTSQLLYEVIHDEVDPYILGLSGPA